MIAALAFHRRAQAAACGVLLASLPVLAHGEPGVSGNASGITIATALVNLGPTPASSILPAGGEDQAQVSNLDQPGLVSTATVTVTSDGTVVGPAASSSATSHVEGLSLLGGLVTADLVIASAESTLEGGVASSDATGTTFDNLVIAGSPFAQDPDPNTSITIPGIATIVLNEQTSSGDGVSSSAVQVNAVRVTLLAVPGEIVVAHADSGVAMLGLCTQSGSVCMTVADCPAGEGCCGNATLDAPAEQCDDGNGIDDDLCGGQCTTNESGDAIVGCEDLPGSSIVPLFVRRATISDWDGNGKFERWKSNGDFALFESTAIDPDSETTTIVMSQGLQAVYDATLQAGTFSQRGSAQRPRWKYRNKGSDMPGAPGWRRGDFGQRLNRVRTKMKGTGSEIQLDMSTQPVWIRQTIRVDDICATTLMNCVPAGASGTRLRCRSNKD